MYLEHFGLRETPFRITPHADFFFGGANRRALLDAIVYALDREEGLIKVSGEVGTGKTMLARVLIEHLPAHLRAIYLADPLMNRGELLAVLAEELGCAPATGSEGNAHRVLRSVQEAMVTEFARGRQIVLLIDEAHAMPADTLEQIRLLSNLESERHKLMKIALFGQPELDEMLARVDMRQLKDRITQQFRLDPLEPDDVGTYIDFRMRAAGYRGPSVFEPAAVASIARNSGGLTRRINVLADKSLLSAYARDSHAVGQVDAERAASDAQMQAGPPAKNRYARMATWVTAASALLLAGFLLGRETAAPAVTPRPTSPPAAAVGIAPIRPAVPPGSAESVESTEVAKTAPPSPEAANQDSAAMASPAVDTRPDEPAATTSVQNDLESLLAHTRAWSDSAPGEHWFIQLMSVPADQGTYVRNYIARASRSLDPQQLRAYRSETASGLQLAVIYGDYPDQRSVQKSLAALPDWIASTRPIARQIRSLREP